MTLRLRILCLLLAFNTTFIFSQPDTTSSKKELIIRQLEGVVTFDGVPDEAAWDKIPPVSLIMHSPVFGKEPTELSDIRIAYDDKYLYVGARLFYQDISMVRSVSFKRDFMGMGSDWLGLILDTFDDNENAMAFFTTPSGLRFDANIQRDAFVYMPDQLPMNINWNSFWDVLTKSDQRGWTAEMRIPVSSLRFQEQKGEVRMGMIVWRWIASKNEIDIYPSIPPNWGPNSMMKPSQAGKILFKGLKPEKPLYITPYAVGGFQSTNALNDAETKYIRSDKPVLEAGLDLKYGISKGLIMDVTVNTDFAQVEADDQQINLTRFSLYFPEKRLFFLERASIFDFSLGGNSNLFYSRRIGLSDDEENPEQVRIYGGVRVTGRINNWDVGFLNMQTAPLKNNVIGGTSHLILPSENFSAVRLRRQVINQYSYIGAMATSRLGTNGSYNIAYGVDGILRVVGDDYLQFTWGQSFEDSVRNNSINEPSLLMASWERRASKGIKYSLGYTQSGIHFDPGIGFEMLNDYREYMVQFGWGWIPGEKSKLYSHSPETMVMYRTYIDDGSIMSFTNFTGWTFQTKNQWNGTLNFVYNTENLRDSLELLPDIAYVPPTRYNYINFMGNLVTPMSRSVYTMLMTEMGQYYDGSRISFRLQPTWNISRHLELGSTYNFDYIRFRSRNEEMTNHIIGIKALYMFNTHLSFNAFIQYNTALHGIITNLRLRYNPKEGNDLYLVFNEDRNTDLTRERPNFPVYNSRAIMVKYTYTFSL
ncbi:MAG: DUF5916 domain-containing protein [Bacteroidota bacterium]|nr:DUF5916 domain-containing protein [Bacteroidota bacterium]